MYCVYILYSKNLNKYYTGQTDNLEQRLASHARGISPYTSKADDWILVFTKQYATRREALEMENKIKRRKSRQYIEWLISQEKE